MPTRARTPACPAPFPGGRDLGEVSRGSTALLPAMVREALSPSSWPARTCRGGIQHRESTHRDGVEAPGERRGHSRSATSAEGFWWHPGPAPSCPAPGRALEVSHPSQEAREPSHPSQVLHGCDRTPRSAPARHRPPSGRAAPRRVGSARGPGAPSRCHPPCAWRSLPRGGEHCPPVGPRSPHRITLRPW